MADPIRPKAAILEATARSTAYEPVAAAVVELLADIRDALVAEDDAAPGLFRLPLHEDRSLDLNGLEGELDAVLDHYALGGRHGPLLADVVKAARKWIILQQGTLA